MCVCSTAARWTAGRAPSRGYVPTDGVLVCKKQGGGKLFTKKEYANFVLRFEVKLEPGGNNGIAIRAPMEGRPAQAGMEIQVLDNTAERYKKLKPYQYHGSIYGMVPTKRGYLRPVGQWNEEEILCDGPHVKVTLNGTVIVDADLTKIPDPPPDGRPHPGASSQEGLRRLPRARFPHRVPQHPHPGIALTRDPRDPGLRFPM